MATASVDRLEQVPARLAFLFDYSPDAALARPTRARGDGRADGARAVVRALAEELAARAAARSRAVPRGRPNRVKARTGQKGKALFHPIRVALTGRAEGPSSISRCRRSIAAPSCPPAPASRRSSAAASAPRRSRAALARGACDGPSVVTSPRTPMLIYGINPVLEALRAGRVRALRVAARADERVARSSRAGAAERGVPVRRVDGRRARSRGARRRRTRAWSPTCVDARARQRRGPGASARRARRCSSCSTASRIRTTSARFCGRWTRPAPTASSGRRGARRRSTGRRRRRRPARWRT